VAKELRINAKDLTLQQTLDICNALAKEGFKTHIEKRNKYPEIVITLEEVE